MSSTTITPPSSSSDWTTKWASGNMQSANIMVFLALALGMILMIVGFLWWRKMHPLPPSELDQVFGAGQTRRRKKRLGPKPMLWDCWIEGSADGEEKTKPAAWEWEEIMPLAVRKLAVKDSDLPLFSSNPRSTPSSISLSSNAPSKSMFSKLTSGRLGRPTRSHSSIPLSPRQPPTVRDTLQVEVAIIMPSERKPVNRTLGRHSNHNRHPTAFEDSEYAIGLYTCTYPSRWTSERDEKEGVLLDVKIER